uniref:EB domain-containing protein n=1 Tax=Trichogramma kaykai TaxID=54128 RepID=A0ABD2VV76_9HYME
MRRRRPSAYSWRLALPPFVFLLLNALLLAHGAPDRPTALGLSDRGTKKFSDDCKEHSECGFDGSYCDPAVKKCLCREELTATNHIDKCGHPANINESCFFTEQCEVTVAQTECRDGRCICIFEKIPVQNKDGSIQCIAEVKEPQDLRYIDPAMIGILAGMALMFIIICVVLRLFSQARWRENRTIFNTPNARLMNVSLLRADNKLLHAGQERRGSRASVRGPSRQPSMASLRAHSPNASQGAKHSQHPQQQQRLNQEKILLTNGKGNKRSAAAATSATAAAASTHHASAGGTAHHHQHQHPQHHQQQQQQQHQQQPQQDTRITDANCAPLSPGSRTGSRRGSRGSSGNNSAVSGKSNNNTRSSPPNSQHHAHHNGGGEPPLENVTVEIIENKS